MDPRQTVASELVRQALNDARELVRIEVALAKDEVRSNLLGARTCAIAFGMAGVAALLAVAMLLVALALAMNLGALGPLVVGAVLLVIAIGSAAFAWSAMPRKPVAKTQKRLKTDVDLLKEHVTT